MNAKAKGTRNEHRSIKLYEDLGYSTMRSARSAGVFDFHAWNAFHGVYVQVKTGRWPGTSEMDILREEHIPPGCQKIVHRWMPHRHRPDVKEV